MAFSDDQFDDKTDMRCCMFNACLLAMMALDFLAFSKISTVRKENLDSYLLRLA